MLIDNYIDLFENANKRHQSLEKLEKDVKLQLRQLEAERIKLKQVLAEIRRTKDANKIEEHQLVAINESLKQFELTAQQLARNELGQAPTTSTKPVEINRDLFELIDRVREANPKISEKVNVVAPRIKHLDDSKAGATEKRQQGESKVKSKEDNESFDDSTFIDDSSKADPPLKAQPKSELSQYYPFLHLEKPKELIEHANFTVPSPPAVISSSVDPDLAPKFASIQMAFIGHHVPYSQWGQVLNQYLTGEALDAYLDYYHTKKTMTWNDVLYLFFADKDLYVVNAQAIDRWTKMRPEQGQSMRQFVAEFKQAVALSAPFPGRLDLERALLVSMVDMPYEVVQQLQTISDRYEMYRIVMKRVR